MDTPTLLSRLNSLASVVSGQAVWAFSQAAVVLLLSSQGKLSLVGIYTVSLSIFAPICLLGSLNLRTAVQVNPKDVFDPRRAFALRGAVALFALFATCIFLAGTDVSTRDYMTAVTLLAIRVFDQVSEVAIGYHQRDNFNTRVGISFFARGAAILFVFGLGYLLAMEMLLVSFIALVAVFLSVTVVDVIPILINSTKSTENWWSTVSKIVKTSWVVAPYPVLDSLHVNSLRYAVFIWLSAETTGMLGIAQVLFVPFQLIATSIGFRYLSNALAASEGNNLKSIRHHTILGICIGLSLSMAFALFAWAIPEGAAELLFDSWSTSHKQILNYVALAMFPLAASGFASLSLVARKKNFYYNFAPIAALVVFWVICLVLFANSEGGAMSLPIIVVIFTISGVVRLLLSSTAALLTGNKQ